MIAPSDAQVEAAAEAIWNSSGPVYHGYPSGGKRVDWCYRKQYQHDLDRCIRDGRAALTAAAQAAPPTEADMRAFGANEAACYKWPDDSTWHKACRAAYCQGAADYGGTAQAGEDANMKHGPFYHVTQEDKDTCPDCDGWQASLETARECVRNLWRGQALREREHYHLIGIFDTVEKQVLAAAPTPPAQSGAGEDAIAKTLRHWVEALREPTISDMSIEDIAITNGGCITEDLEAAADRIATLTQALAEAEKLMEPFAKMADYIARYPNIAHTGDSVLVGEMHWNECANVGHLRAARAWLERRRAGGERK